MNAPETVKTTARESALYQAGFEAGKAQGELSAASASGSAGIQLEAACVGFKNLRDAIGQVEAQLREGNKPKLRAIVEQLRRQIDYAETCRGSMLAHQLDHQRMASAAKLACDKGRINFAENVARAQALTPRPGLLTRLRVALLQVPR